MSVFKYLGWNRKLVLGIIAGLLVPIIGLSIINKPTVKELTTAFNDGKILQCSDLIISNNNWKLAEDHLINNNSAGYLDISTCTIKK